MWLLSILMVDWYLIRHWLERTGMWHGKYLRLTFFFLISRNGYFGCKEESICEHVTLNLPMITTYPSTAFLQFLRVLSHLPLRL